MEGGVLVTEALLASAESAEVLGGLRDILVEEVEVDAPLLRCSRKVRSAGRTMKKRALEGTSE